MQNINAKLGEALREATSIDLEVLEEEMKGVEPHVFSDRFNKNMKKLFWRIRVQAAVGYLKRHAAVAVIALLFISGAIWFISAEAANASKPSVDVLAWIQEYFSFEKGEDARKETDVLFEESQIGFIPEGFEKISEVVNSTYVKYEYTNVDKDYIILRVDSVKSSVHTDSESISKDTAINADGYEFTYIYNEDNQNYEFMWEDDNGLCYDLIGNVNQETMIQIMDNINYER